MLLHMLCMKEGLGRNPKWVLPKSTPNELPCRETIPTPPPQNNHLDTIDRKGISPVSPIPSQGTITIESLARIDRDYTPEDLNSQLGALESQRDRVVQHIQQRQLIDEEPRPSSQQQISAIKTWERTLCAARPAIQAMPHILGDVHSASSHLVNGGRVIDWAFVKLTPEVPKNQMPRITPSGRTANVTGGMCNGVVAVCNWKTRYDINDNTVDGKDLRTEEFTIIGVQGSFLESGDSGSFVVDSTGAVAGLMFAEYKHNFQTVALALPVPDIIDTMKARVKAPVSLRLP
ncbi:hypothetical protein N7465_003385 [Penicillium sp. CMV-2018d]|nr:hypothetical protein N7465_003385 [Penicillium sp. CMV-2018d]